MTERRIEKSFDLSFEWSLEQEEELCLLNREETAKAWKQVLAAVTIDDTFYSWLHLSPQAAAREVHKMIHKLIQIYEKNLSGKELLLNTIVGALSQVIALKYCDTTFSQSNLPAILAEEIEINYTLLIRKQAQYGNCWWFMRNITLADLLHQKIHRIEHRLSDSTQNAFFESTEDSYRDIINYAALGIVKEDNERKNNNHP